MSGPERERILESVARGEITPAEGDALLKALQRPRPSWWRWLFFPMELISTRTALIIGAAVAAAALGLSRFGIRFDGALDTHLSHAGIPVWVAVADLLVSWPLVALLFWGASRLAGKPARLVDHLAAVGVARAPLIPMAVALALTADHLPRTAEEAMQPERLPFLLLHAFVLVLPFSGWFITLLVTGYRAASGLRGARLVLSFLGALVVAELLSKAVLFLLPG